MTAPLPGQPHSGQYHGSWSSPPAPPGLPPGAYGQFGPYGYPVPAPTSTNGMAIASMVLGIVWIYWIGSILAVVFGHISLAQIKRHPYQAGRGMAIAGLVLGYLGLAILTLFIAAMIAVGSSSDAGFEDVSEVRYSSSG